MMKRLDLRIFGLVAALLLVLGGAGFDVAAAASGDQTAVGTVTKMGVGSFVLRTEGGKEQTFNVGRGTKYDPSDFRAREGDKVEVTFYDKQHRDRMIQAVSSLRLIKANPSFKEPANPATGTIKEAGKRGLSVYIPELKKAWKFEYARGWDKTPGGWTPAVDDQVKIDYKRVPSRFSSGYVYQLLKIEKM